ncbi:hypothetical protein M0Q97_07375 [Candidatus Dojkabacteria bacterium]|jgi:hypothetical protein|nr:hypothetical protein [Candidatus Dojkabacteria bacterium]
MFDNVEPYLKFKYYFPPRPETVIPPDNIKELCEGKYYGQVKMNGSCCEVYTHFGEDGKITKNFGRHQNENLSNLKLDESDYKVLSCGNNGWNLVVGEYMNKGKEIDNKLFNHVFVIFDILVYDSKYLIGTTVEDRIELLDKLFGTISENEYLYKVTDTIYRVKTFKENLKDVWDKMMKDYPTDKNAYEGLVFKKPQAKLMKGLSEKNNILWHLKSRRATKNYRY